ncbi:Piwi domain-containing protein [Hymenobacter monticola]|uniref:Protein argonaute n=1 Tax=Hymenobacter monticola TaxID=1705399 RepID=A0ABY4BC01_9BACT|nr:Piwi domain-containing protein [Hymenobacter monticola]UOE36680.1 hypothetical protein MTP16_25210 [Hymenobacter monticola]
MTDILLSFLAIREQPFAFTVYRKLYDGAPKTEDSLWIYPLPEEPGDDEFKRYYVAFEPVPGFVAYECPARANRNLTCRVLTLMVQQRAEAAGIDHSTKLRGFHNSIDLYTESFTKGKRALVLEPYYLESKRQFGFLVDVRFRANKSYPKGDAETLQLSFSNSRNGGVNKNFYGDKYNYVTAQLSRLLPQLGPLAWQDLQLSLVEAFSTVTATTLAKKQYIFKNDNYDYNQFSGIRRYGPYRQGPSDCTFVFILEERYRAFANKLFLSLTGKRNPDTFKGMHEMFQVDIGKNNIVQIPLLDTSEPHLAGAVEQVRQLQTERPNEHLITIFVEENNHADEPGVSETYYYLKYHLTKLQIPLQVLSHEKISVDSTLKWSTSNIGLALFAKLGGIPWIVKPSISNCLILGIGSAHKFNDQGQIERFFAYSVCLDSSGIYRKLEVLADDHSEESYLSALQRNLVSLLGSPEFAGYTKCALHLPFKIKHQEIDSIKAAIGKVRSMEFKVLKINVKNKFFGYSNHNTKTPYASTLVELNPHEFLVWFEGLQQGKEVLNERISPPVHIEFLHSAHTSRESVYPYLQDAINLTGTNWRGFNAKVKVISIYYSSIIADYCTHFEQFPDFRKDMLSLHSPWFL